MRRAVIDIGTNTLLLLVTEPDGQGGLRAVLDRCEFGRLGQGLAKTGAIADEAIARSLDICRGYRADLDALGVTAPTIIATQSLREASNAAAFRGPAEAILGAPIEVIAGEREAALAFTAVARTFPNLRGTPYLVVDVGGGSTEIIATDGIRVESAVSLPIGAVKLHERHLRGDPPADDEWQALEADIDARLTALGLPRGRPIVAVAGTATTLAAIQLGLADYSAEAVTGLRLEPATVTALYRRLATATVAARLEVPGMVRQRADVLPAGAAIFARLCAVTQAPVLITCDRGIRWGVAYSQADTTA